MFAFVSLPKSSSCPRLLRRAALGKEETKKKKKKKGSSRFLRRRRRRVFKATKKKDEDDEDDIKTVTVCSLTTGRNFTNKDDDFDDNVDVDDALRPSGATKPMDVSTPRKRRERRQFEEILAVERVKDRENDAQINRARSIGRDAIGG